MELVEIYVNDQEVAGEYIAQVFFEWQGQEWEMTVKASGKAEAEAVEKAAICTKSVFSSFGGLVYCPTVRALRIIAQIAVLTGDTEI